MPVSYMIRAGPSSLEGTSQSRNVKANQIHKRKLEFNDKDRNKVECSQVLESDFMMQRGVAKDIDYLLTAHYAVVSKQIADDASIALSQTQGRLHRGTALTVGAIRNKDVIQKMV